MAVQKEVHDLVVTVGGQLADITGNMTKIATLLANNAGTPALGPDDVRALSDGISSPLATLQATVSALANPAPPPPSPAPVAP